MLLTVKLSRPPRPSPPASGRPRPDLLPPEHLLPGSKSAEPLCGARRTRRGETVALAVAMLCLWACGSSKLEHVPAGWEYSKVISVDSFNCSHDAGPNGTAAAYTTDGDKVEMSVQGLSFSCFSQFAALLKEAGPNAYDLLVYPADTEMMPPNGEIPCMCIFNFKLSFNLAKGHHKLDVYTWHHLDQPPRKDLSTEIDLK